MNWKRRDFVKTLSASTMALWGSSTFAGGVFCKNFPVKPRFRKPNEKLNIGVIGVGGKGWSNWVPMFEHGENIVALCDIDRTDIDKGLAKIDEGGKKSSEVKCYSDFRKMLDECKNLDAVIVSTPDHIHAPAAIRAMRQGAHVYVEKPLVRTLWENDYFARIAREYGVVTQMGNQGSARNELRRCAELLQQGVIGDATEVHVWTNRPVWPQGMARPDGEDPIPATVEWDLWLGTAQYRPYKANTYHKFKWRGFWDFGTGAFGDMACHTMNLPFRGLQLGAVSGAECVTIEGRNRETYPNNSIVKLFYKARKDMPPVTLYWYDGNLKPTPDIMPKVVATLGEVPKTGCYIIGSKGSLVSTNDYGAGAYLAFNDESKMTAVDKHEACSEKIITPRYRVNKYEGATAHHLEFINACKGQDRCFSDIDHSIPMMEGILTGCIAQQLPGKLFWDGKTQSFIGNKQANDMVRPFIRDGWEF